MPTYDQLEKSLVTIASELYRFEKVFVKAVDRLDVDEQSKYVSQFSWFAKRVDKAMREAGLKLLNMEGKLYDPGMAVTPLNIEEFENEDELYIEQMIEPIIMKDDELYKMGTAILGRIKE